MMNNQMAQATHEIGISSFAFCFACGSRPHMKPEKILTPFDLIDKAVKLGVRVVQFGDNMPLEKYTEDELGKIKDYAMERGIVTEAGMRGTTSERLSEYIRITHSVGGKLLRVITDGAGYEPTLEECRRVFASVTPMLEECGVTLGIENHDRFHASEYAGLVEAIGHPYIGLTVDSVNSLSVEESIDEVLRYMAPHCVCLHIKDYEFKRINGGGGLKITGARPGTGRLDIRKCIEECSRSALGKFNIILESWMEPCETIEETLRKEDEWAEAGVELLKRLC